MNKNDLIENNTNDELADMVIKLQQKFENSQSEINYRQKRIEELSTENQTLSNQLDRAKHDHELLVARSTEKAYKYIRSGQCLSLLKIVTMEDEIEDHEDKKQIQKLNSTIDVLLDRLKGKSE